MIETIITAILAFASTNVDDLFILMILFTLTSDTFQNKNILTGQYLGIITLVVISLIGSLIGIIIPTVYIGFLGFFPIYLGIMKLITFFKRKDENEQEEVLEIPQRNKSILSSIVGASTLSVASITIANGADNIGIYIPLFVNLSVIDLVITMVRHPALKETLAKYNHILFPIILIGLGIYILVESKSYSLVL
jgi:cadmium resistance protein CadD (predicted permease)